MTLLNDAERVAFLISLLDRHINELPSEDTFANYLESLHGFLKTKDPVNFTTGNRFVNSCIR
jgi:hypothetical protein